jgi:hypothetical protein
MPSRSRKSARWPLCMCSIRPRQRPVVADHSRQKRITKVLTGGTDEGSAIGFSLDALPELQRGPGTFPGP